MNNEIDKKFNYKKLIIDFILIFLILNPLMFEKIGDTNLSEQNIIFSYLNRGFYSGMYNEFLKERIVEPEGYNEELVKNILNENYKTEKKWGKPNVIFVLSEAFWDINNIEEISFDKNVMENFYQISSENQLINIISPTWGGMTTNIEYELLTGNSMRYFSNAYIPFNNIYKNEKTSALPSIVKMFNKNNYDTIVLSPFDDGLTYNVKNVYNYLGFNKILLKKDLQTDSNIKGNGVSDEYLYNLIPEQIKENDKNIFMLVKTAQNHMPYKKENYKENEYDIEVKETKLSNEQTAVLKTYAQGIYDSNKSLEILYENIKSLEEPTIVLYFGDHLPAFVDENGKEFISELSFFSKNDEKTNIFKRFHIKSLIFSNYEIEKQNLEYLSFDGLSSYIINNLDIEIDAYYQWLYKNLNNYIAGNKHILFDTNGNLYYFDELNEEQKNFHKTKEFIQYYTLKNK